MAFRTLIGNANSPNARHGPRSPGPAVLLDLPGSDYSDHQRADLLQGLVNTPAGDGQISQEFLANDPWFSQVVGSSEERYAPVRAATLESNTQAVPNDSKGWAAAAGGSLTLERTSIFETFVVEEAGTDNSINARIQIANTNTAITAAPVYLHAIVERVGATPLDDFRLAQSSNDVEAQLEINWNTGTAGSTTGQLSLDWYNVRSLGIGPNGLPMHEIEACFIGVLGGSATRWQYFPGGQPANTDKRNICHYYRWGTSYTRALLPAPSMAQQVSTWANASQPSTFDISAGITVFVEFISSSLASGGSETIAQIGPFADGINMFYPSASAQIRARSGGTTLANGGNFSIPVNKRVRLFASLDNATFNEASSEHSGSSQAAANALGTVSGYGWSCREGRSNVLSEVQHVRLIVSEGLTDLATGKAWCDAVSS